MTSFFNVGGNPFATPIGMKIEQATSETLPSEDWGLNMEICDLINQMEDGPRDAMKALRKRLTSQPKNYSVILYTLTVLEACIKNCGKKFHVLACSKDFVQDLVKLIGPKNDPPSAIQDKVLSMIQAWAEAFRHQPDLAGVSQVYADLKHKKVVFPPPNPELMAPIFTPQRSVDPPPMMSDVSTSPNHPPPQYERVVPPPTPVVPLTLSPEQKAKLQSELDLVESNSKILAEMLNEIIPGKEQAEDLQLLQDLHATCLSMQQRVVELVGRFNDDLLTADLLRINDDLNNLFVRYERHMGKTRTVVPVPAVENPVTISPAVKTIEDEAPLIDLGGEEAAIDELATLCIGKKPEDADFDSFAQSRTSLMDAKPTDLLSSENDSSLVQEQKPSDFAEMEDWLTQNQASTESVKPSRVPEESVSSSEFDKFLAERAAAADNLPTIAAATGSSSIVAPPVPTARSRTLTKEDHNEKQLFSL